MTVIETAAMPGRRLEWQLAEVRDIGVETPRVKSLLLHVATWQGHLPGQHVDIRLTAEDGYQAQRSYSIASPPEDELVTLTVERVDNGEVSPYLPEQNPKIFVCGPTRFVEDVSGLLVELGHDPLTIKTERFGP
jgi:ferredoxin-NADP reductase